MLNNLTIEQFILLADYALIKEELYYQRMAQFSVQTEEALNTVSNNINRLLKELEYINIEKTKEELEQETLCNAMDDVAFFSKSGLRRRA